MTAPTHVSPRELTAVTGEQVEVPAAGAPGRLVHLQFRRFAGCPVCNLHLRSVVRRYEEIAAAGVREVVLFHSTAENLLPHVADLPFPVVADPGKRLYREFGVESSRRALLHPRAWGAIVRGVLVSLGAMVRDHRPLPKPDGDNLGLPADFLVAADGRIVAAKHGTHAYDQWSVDELLALAAREQARHQAPERGRTPEVAASP